MSRINEEDVASNVAQQSQEFQKTTCAKYEHSVECLYIYTLARLGLSDTDEMRTIFWDANNCLEWDVEKDWYIIPTLDGICRGCS